MHILAIVSGEYGNRHVKNIRQNGPNTWQVEAWQPPPILPPIIDYPEDHLPEELPPADLVLSFAEHRGVAELLPDIAKMTGATGVIASVDNEAWLPRGLARQLRGWLERDGIVCVTPKPLCSLTEKDFLTARSKRIAYQHPKITEFASHFGQPAIKITVDSDTRNILSAKVIRDAVCGCARFTAEGLVGVNSDEAEEKAGLLHHHYPCMASMGIDPDFSDTLMHISGNIMKEIVKEEVKAYKQVRYYIPNQPGSREHKKENRD
jgi:hypothetical protein